MKKTGLYPSGTGRFFCRALLLIHCLTALALGGCQDPSKPAQPAAQRTPLRDVKTSVIALSQVDDVYETMGTVQAEHRSTVASRILGTVTALHIKEGDTVKSGQLLMTVDSRELDQKAKGASMAREAAKQHRALAETTWRRYRNLYEEKALSQQEMDQVDTQRKVAESEYERAKAAEAEALTYLGYARIQAPIAGTVTDKRIHTGSMAVPGQPLLTIEDSSSYYLESFIDEALSGRIRENTPVEVEIDAGNRHLRGTVRDVVAAVDTRSRTFPVKIALATAGLKSGLHARIRIPVGKREALLVPAGALIQRGQLTGVYAVSPDGVVLYRLVKTGRAYPDGRIEILSGLFPNETVITEGTDRAVDGGIIQKN